jgi:hypothetical protein
MLQGRHRLTVIIARRHGFNHRPGSNRAERCFHVFLHTHVTTVDTDDDRLCCPADFAFLDTWEVSLPLWPLWRTGRLRKNLLVD